MVLADQLAQITYTELLPWATVKAAVHPVGVAPVVLGVGMLLINVL